MDVTARGDANVARFGRGGARHDTPARAESGWSNQSSAGSEPPSTAIEFSSRRTGLSDTANIAPMGRRTLRAVLADAEYA